VVAAALPRRLATGAGNRFAHRETPNWLLKSGCQFTDGVEPAGQPTRPA
jgi:hypothetical protein